MLLFVLDGMALALIVFAARAGRPRPHPGLCAASAGRWRRCAGSASIGSYAIALWAMTRAPVASVAALRETSVLFAAVLGTVLLKEKFTCAAPSAPR
jgi:drug/metabolite transporter (DMT)-like permease